MLYSVPCTVYTYSVGFTVYSEHLEEVEAAPTPLPHMGSYQDQFHHKTKRQETKQMIEQEEQPGRRGMWVIPQ